MRSSSKFLSALMAVAASFVAAPATASVPDLTPAEWRADVDYLARQIPATHKNAFHFTSRMKFNENVRRLRHLASTGSDVDMVVGIKKLVASLGDGHSSSPWGVAGIYPLHL